MRDGIPYAIDFTNPAPDADIFSVTEPYFEWITDCVAEMLVDYALHGVVPANSYRWSTWLNSDLRSDVGPDLGSDVGSGVGSDLTTRSGDGG